jgi:hypothetical protein
MNAGSVTPHLWRQGTAGFIGRAGHPSMEGISTARPHLFTRSALPRAASFPGGGFVQPAALPAGRLLPSGPGLQPLPITVPARGFFLPPTT